MWTPLRHTLPLLILTFTLPLRASAEPSQENPDRTITVTLTGDIYIDAPTRNTLRNLSEKIGPARAHRELLAEVAPTLRKATLTIVNLETPVCPRYRERRPGEPPIFSAHDQLLDALRDAGVDAITLANNHAYDQGLRGLRETLERAEELGIPTVGVSQNEEETAGPLLLPTELGSIGLCAWTQSLNLHPHDAPEEGPESEDYIHVSMLRNGDEPLGHCLDRARASSDFVIALLHLTPSAWRGPRAEERALIGRVADAGAELIIAHGPHIPGPSERLRTNDGREILVVYSMGNLVGAMGREVHLRRRPRASERDAPIITLTLHRAASGRLRISAAQLTPFWIADAGPRSPFWPAGQPLTRPLSIAGELTRAAKADCGARCELHARTYRRRARLLASAIDVAELSLAPQGAQQPADAVATVAPPDAPQEAPSEPEQSSEQPQGRPAEIADANEASAEVDTHDVGGSAPQQEQPARASASTPEPAEAGGPAEPGTPTELDPNRITTPILENGVILPLRFTHNRVPPEIDDVAALTALAHFLRDNRELHIELEGSALANEDLLETEHFGARRARAAMWELSARGPSRSRFEVTGATEPGTPRVVLRVTR